jgi:hypothetical protein
MILPAYDDDDIWYRKMEVFVPMIQAIVQTVSCRAIGQLMGFTIFYNKISKF